MKKIDIRAIIREEILKALLEGPQGEFDFDDDNDVEYGPDDDPFEDDFDIPEPTEADLEADRNFVRKFGDETDGGEPSEQAHKLGLTHAGYGYWKDKSGNTVARTWKGHLIRLDPKDPQGFHNTRNPTSYEDSRPLDIDGGATLNFTTGKMEPGKSGGGPLPDELDGRSYFNFKTGKMEPGKTPTTKGGGPTPKGGGPLPDELDGRSYFNFKTGKMEPGKKKGLPPKSPHYQGRDPYTDPDKPYNPDPSRINRAPRNPEAAAKRDAMMGKVTPPKGKDGGPVVAMHNGKRVYVDQINRETKTFTVTPEDGGDSYEVSAKELKANADSLLKRNDGSFPKAIDDAFHMSPPGEFGTPRERLGTNTAGELLRRRDAHQKTIAEKLLRHFSGNKEKANKWLQDRMVEYPQAKQAINSLRYYLGSLPQTNESVLVEDHTPGEQAKALGLHHIGWGRYANEEGKVVAKSINGQLVKLDPTEEEDIPDEDHGIFDKQLLKHLNKVFATAGEWTPQPQDTGATHINPGWNKTQKDIPFDANGEETVKKLLQMVGDPKKLLLWLLKKFKEETPNGKKRILQYVGILDSMGVLESGDAQAVAQGKEPEPKDAPEERVVDRDNMFA